MAGPAPEAAVPYDQRPGEPPGKAQQRAASASSAGAQVRAVGPQDPARGLQHEAVGQAKLAGSEVVHGWRSQDP